MFDEEKKKMTNYRKKYDKAPIPEEKLDQAIREGLERAQTEKTKKPKKMKTAIWIAVAAAVVLFGFSQGFGKIMDMIHDDKGLADAVENDYYQEIDASEKIDGTEVTIDGAIADEKGISLFYTIHDNDKNQAPALDDAQLESAEDEDLDAIHSTYGERDFADQPKDSNAGVMKFFYEEPYESRSFEAQLTVNNDAFDINFDLDDDIGEAKTYDLDEDVTVEGQTITVEKVEINPTRTAVHLKANPDNTKRLLNFDDLELEDERGETWGKTSGVSGMEGKDEGEKIIYLESNYFHEPKELDVTFHAIQAVDKSEDELVIDTDKEEIIDQPDSGKFKNLEAVPGGFKVELAANEDFYYTPFSTGEDADGDDIELPSISSTEPFEAEGKSSYVKQIDAYPHKKLSAYASPLTFPLDFYPEWIEGDVELEVK